MSGARTLVVGSGIVGTAAAWDLVRRGHAVTVADRSEGTLAALSAQLDVSTAVAEVEDGATVAHLMSQHDAVVSAVPYTHGHALAAAAVATGTHFADFGGNPTVVKQQLRLDSAAKKAGVAVVPDCGLAPGLANVLAADMVAALDAGPIDSVQMRVGALPQEPVGALGYQLTFSPGGLINEYAESCEVLERGAVVEVEPLTRFETVEWDPWGPLEAFSTAGGTSSLCHDFAGKIDALEYKTLRYPGHGVIFRAMLELGLFDEGPWDIGGRPIAPRPVLVEALTTHLPRGAPDMVLVRVWASQGPREVGIEMVDRHDGTFSALARTTAFPATALVDLLVRSELEVRGARTMAQAITGAQLLPELGDVGIMVTPLAR
jgi:lysine 6-dehydrogenase